MVELLKKIIAENIELSILTANNGGSGVKLTHDENSAYKPLNMNNVKNDKELVDIITETYYDLKDFEEGCYDL